jgi:hypothetical protein
MLLRSPALSAVIRVSIETLGTLLLTVALARGPFDAGHALPLLGNTERSPAQHSANIPSKSSAVLKATALALCCLPLFLLFGILGDFEDFCVYRMGILKTFGVKACAA